PDRVRQTQATLTAAPDPRKFFQTRQRRARGQSSARIHALRLSRWLRAPCPFGSADTSDLSLPQLRGLRQRRRNAGNVYCQRTSSRNTTGRRRWRGGNYKTGTTARQLSWPRRSWDSLGSLLASFLIL